jgi:ADP-ribosylglycohydrolase
VALAQAGTITPERLETLGGGWVGEEALAIALASVLAAQDSFERGVLLAINHSGDSDSTGAIAGNILGVLLGATAIPRSWLERLELRSEIEQVAADLHTHFNRRDELGSPPRDWERYPGW